MNIAIYQIDPDRDENNVAFLNYENLERFQGSAALRSEIYDKVFEGEVECGTLEKVYQMFNLDHPDGYRGRSLSVSDVVEVVGEEKSTFHFCDSIGFREVDFDPDMTEPLKEKKIKVVLCEPGKVARVAEIGTELSDLQRVVGGLIEPYYPFEEQVCIVCNDEGKYNGMRPCRAIYGEDREMMDIMLSIDVIPIPTDEAVREVERLLLGVETNITGWQRRQNQNNNFSAVVPYDMELQRKESKEFLDDLTTRDQRMMFAVVTMVITADAKEQLDLDTETVLSTARKHMCQMATLKYQQTDGLNTVLPIGTRKKRSRQNRLLRLAEG